MLLLAASSVALVLLVVHSWRRRGRAVTLTFFIAGMLFGIVRGNVAWLVMYSLTGHPEVTKPYLPQGGLLPAIGHASFQVAAGWVFSLYLAWTISELILRRLPRLRGRVFVLSALASLFMLLICYCMETTAVTTGWWYWTMPTRSALYGNVNKWAMRAWFSVAHDFLMPFLIIVCSTARRRRLRWLWLAAFPLHKSCHFLLAWTPLTDLVHHVMALFVVALMLFSKLRMERGEIREPRPPGRRAADVLPGAALIIFFLTLTVGNVLRDAGAEDFLTLVPLLMFSLLAWRRLPVWVVLGLSVVAAGGWFWIGARALYALAPVGVYGFLALQSRLREPLWSKLATLGVAVALAVCAPAFDLLDAKRGVRYLTAWKEVDRLAALGREEEADGAFEQVVTLRPWDTLTFYRVALHMSDTRTRETRQSARILQHRMKYLIREFEELVRRDPEWLRPRDILIRHYLLLGDVAMATRHCRQIARHRPQDSEIQGMLGYLLLRQGELAEAEQVCDEALRLRRPPVEAVINMGVIRFHQERDVEARALWRRALEEQPRHPVARLNMERSHAQSPDREVNLRYLARTRAPFIAPWANNLAAYGKGYDLKDKERLLLEATQFDPRFTGAHLNLAERFYLPPASPLCDARLGLWHARRALEGARESRNRAALLKSLLALGCALAVNGEHEEARRTLEEGKAASAGNVRRRFQRLLDQLGNRP